MIRLDIGPNKTFFEITNLIRHTVDSEVLLNFDKDSIVPRNALNLRVLKAIAESFSKKVKFDSMHEGYKDFMRAVNDDKLENEDPEVDLNERSIKNPKKSWFKFFGKKRKHSVEDSERSDTDEGSDTYESEMSHSTSSKRRLIKPFIFLVVGAFGIVGLMWAMFWYIPTATIKITSDFKGFVRLVDVKAVVGTSTISAEKLEIPAFKVEVTETDSQTIPTTGKKETGEKATGEITITNKTSEVVTVKKGTVITLISSDKDNLKYETKEDIEISATTEEGTPPEKKYGTKIVKITALAFGDKYNLDKNEKFDVDGKDTDDVISENEEDIKGGTSETKNVVAQADIDSVRKSHEGFMKEKAISSLKKKVVTGQVLEESSINFELVDAQYSKQLDDEGDELELSITIKGVGLAYDKDTLDELMREAIKTLVPPQFSLDDTALETEIAATKSQNDSTLNLQVKLKSSLSPNFDKEKIKNDLLGMRLKQAQEYLDKLENKKGFEVIIFPDMSRLPGLLMRIPSRSQNVSIEILN